MTDPSRSARHKGNPNNSSKSHNALKEYDVGFLQAVEEIEEVQARMVHLVEALERGEESMVNNHRYLINDTLRKMATFPEPFDKKHFLSMRKDLVRFL